VLKSTLAGAIKFIPVDNGIWDPLVIRLYPPLFQSSYVGMGKEGEHGNMGRKEPSYLF
jgi:hypothetical protein